MKLGAVLNRLNALHAKYGPDLDCSMLVKDEDGTEIERSLTDLQVPRPLPQEQQEPDRLLFKGFR